VRKLKPRMFQLIEPYDRMGDSTTLNSRDMVQLTGYCGKNGLRNAMRSGAVPQPSTHNNGAPINSYPSRLSWTLGDIRAFIQARDN